MTKLLVFAGSTREQSLNRRLARVVAQSAGAAGAEVTHLELTDYDLPMYNGDLEARGTPANVIRLKEIFFAHPAWIVVSPEYNASYPGLVKNLFDWLSRPVKDDPVWGDDFRASRGKVVGVMSASNGGYGGVRSQGHLIPLLANLHCWVAPKTFALARASSAFDDQGGLADEATRKRMQGVIEQVLWAAQRLAT